VPYRTAVLAVPGRGSAGFSTHLEGAFAEVHQETFRV
jgi:hypothetical protein